MQEGTDNMENKSSAPAGMPDDHLLADTAVLAGEIMLIAGAETCRVEDTMMRMLKTGGLQRCDAFVVTTGITVTIEDPRCGIISLTRRIREKQTNLNRIDQVNTISRKFCADGLNLNETYEQLSRMEQDCYADWQIYLAIVVTAACFTVMLGGGVQEAMAASLNGIYFILARILNRRLRLNGFVFNMAASFFMSLSGIVLREFWMPGLNLEPFIAGSIMAMLPGVAMTNGIRDTLEGDYMSGSARMIEAFVVASSLALGIGTGMAAGHFLLG